MYERDKSRIASSELNNPLFGDIAKYRDILTTQKEILNRNYPDETLRIMVEGIDSRIISIAPMVLFDTLSQDLGIKSDERILAGLGLISYSVSTHDDVVDERPAKRLDTAGLIYIGDITMLEGAKLLIENGDLRTFSAIVKYLNLTNQAQTQIVRNLWDHDSNEQTYLESINTTRYWAEVGLQAAIVHANRPELHNFVDNFSIYYGKTCQLFDDMREIDDDVKNGYYSLPIFLAHENGWDLETSLGKNLSIKRSKEIANEYIQNTLNLCGDGFPGLKSLVQKLKIGLSISY